VCLGSVQNIMSLFEFQLRCCNCNHSSDTYEPLIDLSLEIEDVETLPRALESFTKVEKIEDSETKFTCENCKEEVLVEKQFMLDQAPSVAAFHLKRFKTDGSFVEKVDKHVEFPLQLDLQPYTTGSQNTKVGCSFSVYVNKKRSLLKSARSVAL
jgi:ubiquitin carboxyl-terminal hydrolase 36/42